MQRHLPNILTLANLFCGCCAVVLWLDNRPFVASAFTVASFVLDYADGLVARMLRVHSPLGKELDSLADVVSFGVVPGIAFYLMLAAAHCGDSAFLWCWPAAGAFVLTIFAAYRLGRFNLDPVPRAYFIGLSTPACTLFVLGLALAARRDDFSVGALLQQNFWAIYLIVGLLSYAMVSNVPLHGFKLGSEGAAGHWRIGLFATLGALLIWGLGPLGLSAAVVLYVVYSLIYPPGRGI